MTDRSVIVNRSVADRIITSPLSENLLPHSSLREADGSRECAPDDRLREDSRAPVVIASEAKQSRARAVIASEAKQSIAPRKERMDCFASLAMTASPDAHSRSRGAMRPRFCVYLSPKEGVGNAGCPLHPRPRVHLVVVERTRVTTSTRNHPTFPHAMVLTVSFVLSPAIGLFCHRRPAD